MTTSFPVSGTFPITVKVTNEEGDTNSVTGKIYVIDEDKPFALLTIRNDASFVSAQKNICS
jgi:ATP sulfurylase